MATNSARLSTCCEDSSTHFTAMTELRKKYLQLYCRNWNKSWYSVCFTSSDGHWTHKDNKIAYSYFWQLAQHSNVLQCFHTAGDISKIIWPAKFCFSNLPRHNKVWQVMWLSYLSEVRCSGLHGNGDVGILQELWRNHGNGDEVHDSIVGMGLCHTRLPWAEDPTPLVIPQ